MIKQAYAQAKTLGVKNPLLKGRSGSDIDSATDGSLFFDVLTGVLAFMMILGTIIALINFVQAGVEWIGSAGDSSKLEKARGRLTNAAIGLIILAGSYAIWKLVTIDFLGITVSFSRLFP